MKHIKAIALLLALSAGALFAGGDGSTNTASSGRSNIQPTPGTKTVPPAKTVSPVAASTETMKKKIQSLELQIARLNRLYVSLKKQMATRAYVWQTAATVVNRAFGKTASNTTRVPLSQSTGGVSLAHIIVGKDTTAGEAVGSKGVRCTIVGWGGKYAYRAFLYIYAVPVKDMIMRAQYLIHADDNVPCIKGRIQTHHTWKGSTVKGVRMSPGKYKIFVRLIVYSRSGKRIGQAMRYWGDSRPNAYALSL